MTIFVTACDKCGTQLTELKVGASCVAEHTAFNYYVVEEGGWITMKCGCGWSHYTSKANRAYAIGKKHSCGGHMKFVTAIDGEL